MTYAQNPDYWDKDRQPMPDRNEISVLREGAGAGSSACRAARSTCSRSSRSSGGKALLTDPNVDTIELRAVGRTARCTCARDKEPFNDKRVRQAMALLRQPRATSSTACSRTKADFGNDSPFAPVFPSTDKTSPQRKQDVEQGQGSCSPTPAGATASASQLRTLGRLRDARPRRS